MAAAESGSLTELRSTRIWQHVRAPPPPTFPFNLFSARDIDNKHTPSKHLCLKRLDCLKTLNHDAAKPLRHLLNSNMPAPDGSEQRSRAKAQVLSDATLFDGQLRAGAGSPSIAELSSMPSPPSSPPTPKEATAARNARMAGSARRQAKVQQLRAANLRALESNNDAARALRLKISLNMYFKLTEEEEKLSRSVSARDRGLRKLRRRCIETLKAMGAEFRDL